MPEIDLHNFLAASLIALKHPYRQDALLVDRRIRHLTMFLL